MEMKMTPSFIRLPVLATMLALACVVATKNALARVPLEVFAADPIAAPRLSPSGQYTAVPAADTAGNLVVYIVDNNAPVGTKPHGMAVPDSLSLDWVDWANDDRVLLGLTRPHTPTHQTVGLDLSVSRVLAVDRDGKNFTVLAKDNRRLSWSFDQTNIVHTLPDDPKNVLMSGYDNAGHYNLYRTNVYDGKAEIVEKGSSHTVYWKTDVQGTARLRWDYVEGRDRAEIYLRQGDSDNWDIIAQFPVRESREFIEDPILNVAGFTDDPKTAIVVTRQGGDKYGLFEYDIAKRSVAKPIFNQANVDVGLPLGGPLYDPYTTKLIGVEYVDDKMQVHYFDENLANTETKLKALFPNAAEVFPISWARDLSRMIVATAGPTDSGTFYFLDSAKNQISMLSNRYARLPSNELGKSMVTPYTARDGTRLQGYLTLPPSAARKNLPTVIMPHGGPESRDYLRYDDWAQTLANRGYAVFQPNFRGSGGYGRTFAEAGHRQWGRLMQDDITDGVKALIADGTTDANRVCIVGASYGGYAALAGGAFTPDLYKCVVSIAGVSDIPEMLDTEERHFGRDSDIFKYWLKRLGDPKTDAALQQSISPALQAKNFKVPVLIIHGTLDTTVPIDQSKRMDSALRSAGKQVKFVEIPFENHHFELKESKVKLFTEIEKFLYANIGN